jgi:hypothetical protein
MLKPPQRALSNENPNTLRWHRALLRRPAEPLPQEYGGAAQRVIRSRFFDLRDARSIRLTCRRAARLERLALARITDAARSIKDGACFRRVYGVRSVSNATLHWPM